MDSDCSPTLALAQALVALPSITPQDAGCQDLIIARLAKCGFHIESLPFGDVTNLWAWHGNESPLFCFAGHTDVVPPGQLHLWSSDPFTPTLRDGMLFGRGAADMKGSLAAMIVAAEGFIQENPTHRGKLAFLLTSDEEGPAIDGTAKVIEHLQTCGQKIDYCLIGEPTSTQQLGDCIKNGRRGSLNARLRIFGKQGHVAYPHRADNPIHHFAPTLVRFCNEVWDQGNEYFPPTSFQISGIQAGTGAENVIPGILDLQFNFRFSTELTPEIIQQRVIAMLDQGLCNYELEWHLSGLPFVTPVGQLVTTTQSAVQTILGYEPVLSTSGGTSDGRFIAPTGAEVLELGPVNTTIHQVDECVAVDDLEQLTRIYHAILCDLLK
ncbi:succinyl-diaminopimelate desuccinylase [Rhodoferax sp. 4810]|uniref:Succinyl-diaminopimelate desuccinylase n=1 Tax=Thiospirillum jenense TaxID=1653858 RepID=A0A839HDU7_9GAMM|nr:succinyl-diaminopimelate desuccinylase [Thiospirillum jenense]MBB1075423.1 succinyl-diaminopimelate desuccinylase [Rhodoferax jenense]MBB1126801.1 succinyl-diaminopimelate desuccinylase [Thiospirillum jenense]